MPFYRSNYSSDDSVDAVVIDRSPELSDLFRSKRTKIVGIVDEAPVRRAPPETTRQVRFSSDSYSPLPTRRAPRSRPMTEEGQASAFTPLPPKIKKSSSDNSDDDGSFIENRAPKGKSSKHKSGHEAGHKSGHKRKDSKLDYTPEFIEVPSSPHRSGHESDMERARRKQAERAAERERELRAEAFHVASQHADVAHQERKRREEAENLSRAFEQAYIGEQDIRRDAVREAEAAKARADNLAKQLDREKREKKYLERKAQILEREKRLAVETERIRPVLRPVDVFQDARLVSSHDPGADAIRRAQEDAQRRQRNMRDDDSLYGNQREQRRDRRGDRIIFDDDAGRRGHRRQ